MGNYEEARVKLTNSQLNKLRSAAKVKTGTTLTITKKNFQSKELSHELLTTRQKTKINLFASNKSTDVKFSKSQSNSNLSKVIQSGEIYWCFVRQICQSTDESCSSFG